jgi:hypothetical protein
VRRRFGRDRVYFTNFMVMSSEVWCNSIALEPAVSPYDPSA